MLEMLVYPVSAVMKFWHWLLAGVFGMQSNTAWAASVILLVFSVRGIILPFAWQTFKTARTSFLMRAHMEKVTEQYGKSTELEDIKAEDEARKRIQQEHGYNPFAACVPALIQIPVFLGLYRLLLWMAVPTAAEGRRLGVLTDPEIASFREASFFGVPLPAYVSMTEEQFQFLGTTLDDVLLLAAPLILMAMTLTSLNILVSQLRNRSTLEWENTFSRRVYKGMYWVIPIVAFSLLLAGMTGRIPIALLMYWVVNNLFTTAQNSIFWLLTVRKFPSSEIHREAQKAARAKVQEQKQEKKEQKKAYRRLRLSSLTNPAAALSAHREIRDDKRARKAEKKSEKAEKKSLEKERNVVRRELSRREAAAKAAKKAAMKAAKEGGPAYLEGYTRWEPEPETEGGSKATGELAVEDREVAEPHPPKH